MSNKSQAKANDAISAKEVRLIGADGKQYGVVSISEALRLASEADLDLVEVDPQGNPPVCKLMDYGKFKFDAGQKQRESKKKASANTVKEMKYRPTIGPGDFEVKTKMVQKFLSQGNKVKVTIMFRGREVNHPEIGQQLLERITESVSEMAKLDIVPKLEGRNLTAVFSPMGKSGAKTSKATSNGQGMRAEKTEKLSSTKV